MMFRQTGLNCALSKNIYLRNIEPGAAAFMILFFASTVAFNHFRKVAAILTSGSGRFHLLARLLAGRPLYFYT
jgi:hypothetical protein